MIFVVCGLQVFQIQARCWPKLLSLVQQVTLKIVWWITLLFGALLRMISHKHRVVGRGIVLSSATFSYPGYSINWSPLIKSHLPAELYKFIEVDECFNINAKAFTIITHSPTLYQIKSLHLGQHSDLAAEVY